ncbi:MAG: hypothetical protein V1904_05170 [Bacteroidota bacterium]
MIRKQSRFYHYALLAILVFCCLLTGCSEKTDVEKFFLKNQEEIVKLKDFVLAIDSVESISRTWDNKYFVKTNYQDSILLCQGLSLDEMNALLTSKEKTKFPELTIPFESFFWYDSLKTLLNLRFNDIPNVDYVYSKEVVNKSRFEPDDKTETYLNEHWYAWHPWRIIK